MVTLSSITRRQGAAHPSPHMFAGAKKPRKEGGPLGRVELQKDRGLHDSIDPEAIRVKHVEADDDSVIARHTRQLSAVLGVYPDRGDRVGSLGRVGDIQPKSNSRDGLHGVGHPRKSIHPLDLASPAAGFRRTDLELGPKTVRRDRSTHQRGQRSESTSPADEIHHHLLGSRPESISGGCSDV